MSPLEQICAAPASARPYEGRREMSFEQIQAQVRTAPGALPMLKRRVEVKDEPLPLKETVEG